MSKHDLTLLENARDVLNKPASSLDDLVGAAEAAEGVARDAARALEAEAAARERTLASSRKASDLEVALRAHDDQIADLRRRGEIAHATSAALIRRIDEMREAEANRARRVAYAAAAANAARVAASIAPALEKMGTIARVLMRDLAQAELDVMKANRNLPPGAEKLASVESCRLVRCPEPKFRELRRASFLLEVESGRVLGPEGALPATPRPDGKFDIVLPGGSTSGGRSTVATLAEMAEIEVTEYVSRGWPQQIATDLRIPGFLTGDVPWWLISPDRGMPAFPDEVINRLDALETRAPAEPLAPRVSTKLVSVASWDAERAQGRNAA